MDPVVALVLAGALSIAGTLVGVIATYWLLTGKERDDRSRTFELERIEATGAEWLAKADLLIAVKRQYSPDRIHRYADRVEEAQASLHRDRALIPDQDAVRLLDTAARQHEIGIDNPDVSLADVEAARDRIAKSIADRSRDLLD